MQKVKINIIVDSLAFTALLVVVFSGIMLWLVIPGSKGAGGVSLWGLDRHIYKDWHNWSGVFFTGLMLIHLILHLPFIKALPKILFKSSQN